MADVTDYSFRQIITKYGKPDVIWTEFVSADGLSHIEAKKKLLFNLKFSKNEHPIVAQIFGSHPENIKIAASLCQKLGFDGIDLNMGCPDRSVEKQNSGAKMIGNFELVKEIINAAKKGAPKLPISVKTRIGYNKNETETWIPFLLEQNISALTVHLRTRKEMSNVPAHWEYMKKIVEIRNEINKDILIIGNGDVVDLIDAKKKVKETGCDGVMLGRAVFGNPWLFSRNNINSKFSQVLGFPGPQSRPDHDKILINIISKKLKALVEHTKLFEKHLGKHKNFAVMKKYFKAYVNGFLGAKELRVKLMETKSFKEVKKIVDNFLKSQKI